MGQQVGEAFVRVRPNMSGFKSETETGVKSSFSSLAKLAGLAFGGAAVGALIKSSVESAGQSAAITNSVRTQFGALGKSVLDFAQNQGAAFGSLTTNTNQTSYALGKLFINAGANTKQAAYMTTNWEKLGLALNEAKGGGVAGAATALQELQTVAAGTSTRGLHDLGITITSAQIAARAAADGFIQLGKSAAGLTPAQKQLVTFQLAMQSLPEALRQAAANSHSFAAEQARLAVAWDNAKTALGTALLPTLTKGATALADWLTKMERSGRLQHDFNQVASVTAYVVGAIKDVVGTGIHVWESFTHAVGGSKNALIALASAFALLKVGGIGRAATKDAESIGSRIAGAFQGIRRQAAVSSAGTSAAFQGAAARIINQTDAMQKAGDKWSTQMASDASKVKSSVEGSAGGVSALESAFRGASQSAKKQTGAMDAAFAKFASTTQSRMQRIRGAITNAATTGAASFKTATATIANTATSVGTTIKTGMTDPIGTFGRASSATAAGFKGAVSKAASGAAVAFETAATGMKAAAIEVGLTIKASIIQTGIGLLVVAIGIAVGWIITHWDTVKRYTVALGAAIVAVWHGVSTIVIGIGKFIAGNLVHLMLLPLKAFIDEAAKLTGWIPWVGGKISGAAHAVDDLTNSMADLGHRGAAEIKRGWGDLTGGVTKAWSDALTKSGSDPKVKEAAKKSGQGIGGALMGGATGAITALAPSVQKTISDALQNAVAAAHKAIQNAVQSAKSNLDKIGQDLAKTISDIQAKIGGAAGAIAGSPQGAAFAKLKKLIEEGAPAFQIQKAQAELAGQLQNVGKTQKQQVSSQLANLTAAFNKGQIGYHQFEDRLHKILRDDGITMAQALKAGGPAFADAFKAEVAALGKQARAIADLPAKYRGIGGAGGAADLKIIQPLQVIKQEQLKVRTAVEKAAAAAQKQRAAILKNQQKQIALAQEAKSVGARVVFKHTQGALSGGHGAGIAFGSQIAEHTRRTAENTDPSKRRRHGLPVGDHGPVGIIPRPGASAPVPRSSAGIAHSLTSSFSRMAQDIARLRPDLHGIQSAIKGEQAALLRGLREVCADIAAADKDIVAAELGLHSTLENLRRTELRIAEHASQQRDRQIRLQTQTNVLLAKLNRDKGVPGFNKERPGTGSKHARAAAAAGVKP